LNLLYIRANIKDDIIS